jgi:spore germination protein YaaH
LGAAAARAPAARAYASAWIAPFDAFSAQDWDCFDELNVFALAFDARGRPFVAYPALLERAAAGKPKNASLYAVLVNDRFGTDGRPETGTGKSREVLKRWLADPRARDRHVEDLAALAAPYDGLELDYERVPDRLWGGYAELVEKLADKLHAQGKGLHVDLEYAPVYDDDARVKRALRRIGEAADRVNVMTYYERGELPDAPGPGSTPAFVSATGRRALALFPSDKLVLALSLAATDFEVPVPVLQFFRRVRRLHYRAARELLAGSDARPAWDDAHGAPYFVYKKEGTAHEVWYEDERTLGAKAAAARELGAGVGLWYLGATRPDLRAIGLCADHPRGARF